MLHGTSNIYGLPFLFADCFSRLYSDFFGIYLYTCRIGVSLFLENAVSPYRRIGIAVSVSRIGAT
jgi:hypothetical protein